MRDAADASTPTLMSRHALRDFGGLEPADIVGGPPCAGLTRRAPHAYLNHEIGLERTRGLDGLEDGDHFPAAKLRFGSGR